MKKLPNKPTKQQKQNSISRRSFIGSSLVLGAAGIAGYSGAFAHTLQPSQSQNLPPRGYYLIKNAYVLTMDATLGDFKQGDVLVRDGEIKQVGQNLSAAGAEVLAGEGMVVMPGLVDTHWHLWTSLLRSMAGNTEGRGYFSVTRKVGQHYTPESMYAATRLALAEAIHSGITTLHDWSHNARGPAFAEASIKALREAGIRGRYSLGVPTGEGGVIDLQLLEKLHDNWNKYASNNLHLGLAWPGINNRKETGLKELDKARQIGIPVSVHASSAGVISGLVQAGVLAKGMQIIHCKDATEDEIQSIARAGAVVSLSPFSELRIGYGIPPVKELLDAGVTLGISADTTTLTGNADLFSVMKILLNLTNALNKSEFALTAKQALEKGTIEGARSLGLADQTGSLTPGKRADLIMLSANALNLGYVTDPYGLVVEAAQPANVHTVMIDGRILKRNHTLTHLNKDQIIADAKTAFKKVMEKSGW
ncbi:amidohydrolase family protein [Pontibacter cellulosilyticus]|uniref:Amidohydrolase family protein n=1 Tax=Pontibacter cellulosilyticus TaxID=1720253 RepID=A0A923SPD8_9BACT|nr:amidohydrolase family protein [Pontibacter cellulosilyticus]MBC5994045.1 amidohydrolase family protein [Pontibacter cellulosilyticus]